MAIDIHTNTAWHTCIVYVHIQREALYSDRDTLRNDANSRAGHRVSKVSRSPPLIERTYARSTASCLCAGVTLGVSQRADCVN